MDLDFLIANKSYKISIEQKGRVYLIDLEGRKFDVDCQFISENILSLLIDHHSYLSYLAKDKGKIYISVGGEEFIVEELADTTSITAIGEAESTEVEKVVTAPMPGKVIKINVSEKEKVGKNQTLVIVEAMKMENELKSPIDGVVKKILVQVNDLVDALQPLIELE
ncbi:MAG: biotin/lipoyl-containing protein [Candidatus Aminicenantia bacterium]